MKPKRKQFGAYLVRAGLILLGLYCCALIFLFSERHHSPRLNWWFGSYWPNRDGEGPYRHTLIGLAAITLLAVGALLHWLLNSPLLNGRDGHALAPRCAGCGYDLRGAPHDRCPECGAAVEPPVFPARFEQYRSRAARRDGDE